MKAHAGGSIMQMEKNVGNQEDKNQKNQFHYSASRSLVMKGLCWTLFDVFFSLCFSRPKKYGSKTPCFPKTTFFGRNLRLRGPVFGPFFDQKTTSILEGPKMASEQTLPHFYHFFHVKADRKNTIFGLQKRLRKQASLKTL